MHTETQLKRAVGISLPATHARGGDQRQLRPHVYLATQKRAGGRDLQQGDVGTFFLPSSAKKWPLAVIEKTFPGPDGRVRLVQLRLPQAGGGQGPGKGSEGNREERLFKRDVGDVANETPYQILATSAQQLSCKKPTSIATSSDLRGKFLVFYLICPTKFGGEKHFLFYNTVGLEASFLHYQICIFKVLA